MPLSSFLLYSPWIYTPLVFGSVAPVSTAMRFGYFVARWADVHLVRFFIGSPIVKHRWIVREQQQPGSVIGPHKGEIVKRTRTSAFTAKSWLRRDASIKRLFSKLLA